MSVINGPVGGTREYLHCDGCDMSMYYHFHKRLWSCRCREIRFEDYVQGGKPADVTVVN